MTNERLKELAEQLDISLPFDTHCVIGLTDSHIVREWANKDIHKFHNEGKDFHGIAYSGLTVDTLDSYALLDNDLNIVLFVYYRGASDESVCSCLVRSIGMLGFKTEYSFGIPEEIAPSPFAYPVSYTTG